MPTNKKVYKLRLVVSILYLLLSPLTLLPFLTALLSYNTAEIAPTLRDSISFFASFLSPFIFIISAIGGIWCARGRESKLKKIFGRIYLALPLICILLIALIYA